MGTYKTLSSIDVNNKTEKKNGLIYLSWAYAWGETKKKYPEAKYEILKNEQGLPYFESELGYMCFTKVTIDNETHEMWLPVMDGANKAMKKESYTYKVKDWNESRAQGKDVYKDKTVEAATMFDVNKTVMRCLVKNLAMFGLGLYIYAGEDLPEVQESTLEEALSDVKAVKTEAERGSVWSQHKHLQSNEEFVTAIKKKAKEIKENETK
jgi:hypothetical protein